MNTQDLKINNRWKYKKQLADSTFNVYQTPIQHYIKCTGMSIEELYEEAIEEEEQGIPRYRKKINDHVLDFQIYLEQQKLAESTKAHYLNVIISFYKSMDITLPTIINKYDDAPDPRNVEKNITKELIQIMMQNANSRDRAIFSFAALTGQGADEIRHLKIQQIVDSWNTELEKKIFTLEDIFEYREEILDNRVCKLDMRREKTKHNYWVYLPSECSKYIIDYLYERQHGTNDKIYIHSLKDYLFITKQGNMFSRTAVGKIFTETGDKCGFNEPELFEDEIRVLLQREPGQHRVWKSHNFRKYFINTCRRYAGTTLDSTTEFVFSGRELADFWAGHTVKGSIKHYIQYNQQDVDEMKVQYLQVLPYLSIDTVVNRYTSEDKQRLEDMEDTVNDLTRRLEDLQEYIRSKEQVESFKREHNMN